MQFVREVVYFFKGIVVGTIVINGENIRLLFIMLLPVIWVYLYNLPDNDKK